MPHGRPRGLHHFGRAGRFSPPARYSPLPTPCHYHLTLGIPFCYSKVRMPVSTDRPLEVFRVHPGTFWLTLLGALLLQSLLPLKLPLARLMDFPLLAVIYFAQLRRNKVFGIGLGTGIGLLQDALSHGYIGIFGMAKAVVGYLATSASLRFDLESLLARSILMGILVMVHALCLAGLQHGLLEYPPPFQPLSMASGILVNAALGLVVFQLLDRFRRPV